MSDRESLSDKLARLAPHFIGDQPADLRPGSRSGARGLRPDDAEPEIGPESVGARNVRGPRGRYWLRRTTHDTDSPWGETEPVALLTDLPNAGLRIPLDDPNTHIPLADCLFLDCETTGLSGGAGTVSFLTAVGQLTSKGFVVEQYFLPDLSEEAGKLDALCARLADAQALVTYNGAAFDLPLLEGRFHFWRMDPAFRELPHLDLLWPTRAIFRRRIGECSLSNVEARLIKFARVEDLPGAEVPEVYFQYLREGHSPRLHAVFEHNRLDVVSLFVYAIWLSILADPTRPSLSDPDDLLAFAGYMFRKRRYAAAHAALDEAGSRILDRSQRTRLSELRGLIHKREHEYDAAHVHWERVAKSEPHRTDAAEELAKHLEHRKRDYGAALAVVDRALENLRIREALGEAAAAGQTDRLLHRRARLRRLMRG
jgi:uncharacterized protein YprB with RNaseH-like and TPR domain